MSQERQQRSAQAYSNGANLLTGRTRGSAQLALSYFRAADQAHNCCGSAPSFLAARSHSIAASRLDGPAAIAPHIKTDDFLASLLPSNSKQCPQEPPPLLEPPQILEVVIIDAVARAQRDDKVVNLAEIRTRLSDVMIIGQCSLTAPPRRGIRFEHHERSPRKYRSARLTGRVKRAKYWRILAKRDLELAF